MEKKTTAMASRPVDVLAESLKADSIQAQFKNALGEHKDAFVASIIDLYTGDKSLQQCKPGAIIAEALRAATLKLPLNRALGFAYIVVYNNSVKQPDGSWLKVPTPTFVPGYKGYIQLAMRTGQYKTINADVVYEGELLKGDKLSGSINLNGERTGDKVIGYFCYFELLNGFSKTLYMSVADMAKYARRYSPSIPKNVTEEQLIAKANDGIVSKQVGWMGNFNDMALKTVMRRLIGKYGYLSVEMQGAMASDTEEAIQSDRNMMLEQSANSKTIDIATVQFEEVDTETGEVTQPQPQAEPKAAAAESDSMFSEELDF